MLIPQACLAMFPAHIPLFILLVSYYVFPSIASDAGPSDQLSPVIKQLKYDIICDIRSTPPPLALNDCRAAAKLIPQGIHLDPDHVTRTGYTRKGQMPTMMDRRKRVLPAEFRSGSCLIRVNTLNRDGEGRDGPRRAATAMYFGVWPKARQAAEIIVEDCLGEGGFSGQYVHVTELDGWSMTWRVELRFTTDGQVTDLRTKSGFQLHSTCGGKPWNVYETTSREQEWRAQNLPGNGEGNKKKGFRGRFRWGCWKDGRVVERRGLE